MRAFLAVPLLVALIAWPAAARDVALVIGNDAYDNVQSLSKAVNDARAVGDQLEALGFAVHRAENVDQRSMSRALVTFEAELQPGDRALFFYAGHGFELAGTNYLLPTDIPAIRANEEALIRDAAFPVQRIIDGIQDSGADIAILVLDACRDNPFAGPGMRAAAATRGLARIDAPEGVFVLMSAGAKQTAVDRLSETDADPNSIFTRVFLSELRQPGRTLVDIAKVTQIEVRELAASVGHDQTPAYYDQVIGDVLLNRGADGVVAEERPVIEPPQRVARADPADRADDMLGRVDLGGPQPIASFMRSNAGWMATVSLPEPAIALSYRFGSEGDFTDNGLIDFLDQRTGMRMPNPAITLPGKAGQMVIEVRYQRPDGSMAGPYPIRFDPDVALFDSQRQILQQLSNSWVEFREFNGLLVYFTTLISYRCAITEVRYGLDGAEPLRRYDMPACNPDDPFSLPENVLPYMNVPEATRSISLRITWRDGTQSEVATVER